jgi:hypothetical protein
VSYPTTLRRRAETLTSTDSFNRRLRQVFSLWLRDHNPEGPNPLPLETADYHCHRVALGLGGISTSNANDAALVVSRLLDKGVIIEDLDLGLPFGTHTVLRRADTHGILHSSVAIGVDPEGHANTPDTTDHLQVFDRGGYMGIAPIGTVVDYVRAETGHSIEVVAIPSHIVGLAATGS